jgi:hypothetical protein
MPRPAPRVAPATTATLPFKLFNAHLLKVMSDKKELFARHTAFVTDAQRSSV